MKGHRRILNAYAALARYEASVEAQEDYATRICAALNIARPSNVVSLADYRRERPR